MLTGGMNLSWGLIASTSNKHIDVFRQNMCWINAIFVARISYPESKSRLSTTDMKWILQQTIARAYQIHQKTSLEFVSPPICSAKVKNRLIRINKKIYGFNTPQTNVCLIKFFIFSSICVIYLAIIFCFFKPLNSPLSENEWYEI